MFSINKRILLFLTACIGSRFGLAILAKKLTGYLYYLLIASLFSMGIGFLTIYFGGLRKTGVETGGKPIWWNHIRPLHGVLYVIAASLLFYGHRCWGSQVIIIDTIIGLTVFLLYHLREKNIRLF